MRDTLESLFPLIRQVADFVGRRHGMAPEDREDLAHDVCVKLAASDYEKLRQYRGEAKFSTFLKTLATNEALDHIRHRRGKYRPAAKTLQRGEWACRYEMLRRNEGRTPAEALEILERENYQVPREAMDALEAEVVARLPPRSFEGSESLRSRASTELDPEQRLQAENLRSARQVLRLQLRQALLALPPRDRAFLRLYCDPEAKRRGAQLATLYGFTPSEVYRHQRRLCDDLRRRLRELGVRDADVRDLLADWEDDWEILPTHPSSSSEAVANSHE